MKKRLTFTLALAVLLSMVAATAAVAHNSTFVEDGAYDNAKATHGHDQHQHGGTDGHIHVDNYGIDLVSKLELSRVVDGKIADVGVYKDTAYLAAWGGQTCKYNGVHVVDIADVDNPEEIAFIPSKEGSYPGEGVQALTINTAAFSGDILVTNNEKCKQPAGFGGMNIYDVTDPANPEVLAQGFGDSAGNNQKQSAHQIHSVFAWQDDNKAYAVMVDNEEAADIDIVDITNPAKPKLVAEYDLAKDAPGILQPNAGLDEVFLHDMIVKEIDGRQIMMASYWDGGYVKLDVTDDGNGVPAQPNVLADSDFPDPDSQGRENGLLMPDGKTIVPPEGNAHQAEFTRDNAFVIGADEDFSPFATVARNTTDGTDLAVGSGSDTKKLAPGTEITGGTRFVGRACNGDAAVPAPDGQTIAVAERGLCTFTEKVTNIQAAGYDAVVIFNRTASDGCNNSLGMSVEGDIYAFGVAPRQQGYEMFGYGPQYNDAECKAGDGSQLAPIPVGTAGDTLNFGSYFDGWGYVRLFDAGSMEELDTYAIPEAHDESKADGFGDLSVHEVAVSGQDDRLAYLSYYAGGVRAIRITDDNKIEEVGAFIDTEGGHDAEGVAHGGNNFWGIEVFEQDGQEYAALSDRDFGLYIMKLAP